MTIKNRKYQLGEKEIVFSKKTISLKDFLSEHKEIFFSKEEPDDYVAYKIRPIINEENDGNILGYFGLNFNALEDVDEFDAYFVYKKALKKMKSFLHNNLFSYELLEGDNIISTGKYIYGENLNSEVNTKIKRKINKQLTYKESFSLYALF